MWINWAIVRRKFADKICPFSGLKRALSPNEVLTSCREGQRLIIFTLL